MTPKEKAKQLVDIFGKELALKCVDEIIESSRHTSYTETINFYEYWQNVKTEINKL